MIARLNSMLLRKILLLEQANIILLTMETVMYVTAEQVQQL